MRYLWMKLWTSLLSCYKIFWLCKANRFSEALALKMRIWSSQNKSSSAMTHKYLIDGDLSISHLFRISNGSFIFIPFFLMKNHMRSFICTYWRFVRWKPSWVLTSLALAFSNKFLIFLSEKNSLCYLQT